MADSAPHIGTSRLTAVGDPLRALFDQARAGDEPALADLCVRMRPTLYRVAYSIVRDADDADDLAQEALVRTVTKRLLFLGRGSVAAWMTRIASNLAKNRLRDARRRREILQRALPDEKSARGAEPQAPHSPQSVAEDHETRARLLAALERLPERQRDVVRLHVIAALDFADVAEALRMTEANARVTFSHAKKKLLAALQQELS
jgi:RNA polymerase sigma-70 factor (ECF subfamily)